MFDPRLLTIFEHYGLEHQLAKFAEEARELIEAAEAYRETKSPAAWPHLLEEFADVLNVGDQLVSHMGFWWLVEKIRDEKIERQLKRMAEEEACKENDGPL